jgi:DNA-binding NarL/FixJ family response regulator
MTCARWRFRLGFSAARITLAGCPLLIGVTTLLEQAWPPLLLVDAGAPARVAGVLSAREREVLALMAEGLSTREVAVELSYSERTIKHVLQEVTARLQVRNRTQAVAYAVRKGWI